MTRHNKQKPAAGATKPVETIPVHISYEIIRLFSEGLYQSPHKAIEELVSNGYDANASSVHILLPDPSDDGGELPPLWVIDDGEGMDAPGFRQLWRVADSKKTDVQLKEVDRAPIGQFGIGKLAAYVLAWELTHISKAGGTIRYTAMNFREIHAMHQFEQNEPLDIGLFELTEAEAKAKLADIEARDPAAWAMLFGPEAASAWTAAALSDFKNLYDRLSAGRLGWVLSTGLPLHADFAVWLDGDKLVSAKERVKKIKEVVVGSDQDTVATKMELEVGDDEVRIDGIEGPIAGKARIFEKRLTEGKADQYGRSHGFFIRVRGRVINLEDELFGLDVLNHAAWSRFAMEVDAEGLRTHLLSSREGVRESEPIRKFRKYLLGVFNVCRNAYDDWVEKDTAGLDIDQLLSEGPSLFVTEPLYEGVRRAVEEGQESFYVAQPDLEEGTEPADWLEGFEPEVHQSPFKKVLFEMTGEYDRPLRYVPETRTLVINTQHPFIDKLLAASSGRKGGAATLFATSEVLTEALLHGSSFAHSDIMELLKDRERVMRLLAGDHPSTAAEVLRRLKVANRDQTVMERAVGLAFRVLGFEYERRGGSDAGPDGVLYARLGRDTGSLADYRVVYDSKQTNAPSVSADKINLDSIDQFRRDEKAQYAFFIASAYAGQNSPSGKLNKLVTNAKKGKQPRYFTLLRLSDVQRIAKMHYRYGVTLTRLKDLFRTAHTVPEVEAWVSNLEMELGQLEAPVPLRRLFEGIEAAKTDEMARPNVKGVRAVDDELKSYTPEKLVQTLRAVETIVGKRWLEVEAEGDIRLHSHADLILAELDRCSNDLFGAPMPPHPLGG